MVKKCLGLGKGDSLFLEYNIFTGIFRFKQYIRGKYIPQIKKNCGETSKLDAKHMLEIFFLQIYIW